MPYEVLEKKLARIPEQYRQELEDFVDFLLARPRAPQNGFDVATGAKHGAGIFDTIRGDIQKNNVPEMSLEEINADIDHARKSLRGN